MKNKILFFLLLSLFLSATANAALIDNGSFEDPIIATWYSTVYALGYVGTKDPWNTAAITSWTVGNVSVDIVNSSVRGDSRWSYNDGGNQAIDLAGTPGPGSITQSVSTLANTSYTLSFYVSSNGAAIDSGMQVWWNGAIVGTISTPGFGTWDYYTITLQGVNGPANLTFLTNLGGNAGPLLDNVSMQVVPIPAAVWLLGSGLVGLVALKRRRKV